MRRFAFKVEIPKLPPLGWAMISAKPWSLEAVGRLFLGVIMTVCVGILLASQIDLLRRIPAIQREFLQTLVMVLFFQGAALVWIARFLRESKTTWREAFGLKLLPWPAALAAGLGVGMAILPIAWILQALSQWLMEWARWKPVAQTAVEQLQNPQLTLAEKGFFGVFAIVMAPVAEETLFRGILYPALKQTGRPRLALWGTSVAFGVMHCNLATLVPLVFLAVVLTYMYEATGSLLAPIATHGVFNAANFVYLLLADSVNQLWHIS